jgi:hypothetical protein
MVEIERENEKTSDEFGKRASNYFFFLLMGIILCLLNEINVGKIKSILN